MKKIHSLKRLKQEIESIRQQLLELGPIHPGSISSQYHACGTPSCRCHDPVNPKKHGPYNKLTYCYGGKSRCRFVRPECVEELKQRLHNYKTFRRLTAKWIELSIQIGTIEFIDDVPEVPRPPFYDMLKPLELWVPWVFFAAPVHLLGSVLGLWWLLRYFPSLGGVSVPLASLAYAYVVSCWAEYSWDRWAKYSVHGRLVPLIGVALSLILHLPLTFPLAADPLGYAVFAISGFAFTAVVFAVYAVSIYGLYRAIKFWMKSKSIPIRSKSTLSMS